ncbi:cytochrome b5-related protein-like [Maniola hyperantus]|uniref:cytochrome b5-related protein-like n=1 Tax=Aphantopus hyperantus TaxID=2795564 RepID=UPI0015698D80|nr:cytochrome b5-related protein-like [Maniola hyperantus]
MAPKDTDYLEIAHQRAIEKKTHVSFPQLKYPSLRDEGLRDPVQWLQGKSMDDGAEGLWRVHDSLYDLGEFVESHPGGAEWLELTKGTDITEAFECHHIRSIAEKTLPRFYIRDAKTSRNSPFTFKEDGFFRTLKKLVSEEIEKVPKERLRYSDMLTDGLFVTLLVASALSCWSANYWLVMGFYIVASVSLAWLVVASHNYIHRRTNWRMYYFNFSLWSYRDFRVSHALSHHLYPNTLMDLEISAFEPLIFWNPRKNIPIYAYFAIIFELIFFPLAFIINWVKRMIPIFLRDGFFTNHIRWHDLVGFLLPLWMYLASGASFSHALTMWLGIICGGSFTFFLIGSNAAHHHPKIFKDGDQVSDVTLDWGMHELEAVMDRPNINDSHFKVITFFGHHALHHLFPTLDHAVLEYLYPVFIRHCEKYKANFRLASQLELFIGQIKMTLKTDPSLLSERYS